jgi:GNAT superfamily N-acetyltransferase
VSSPVSSGAPALDQQLQRYLRSAAARGRDVEHAGPFLCTFDPHTDLRYVNYAIPADGAQPTPRDIAALVDAYERHDRLPRLEYLPATAPAVESRLLAAGFTVEAHLPAMTCRPADVADVAPAAGIELAVPVTDADLRAMMGAQHRAFGEALPDDDEAIARRRASLESGSLAILARDVATGEVVGGGIATEPDGAVTEIAGIGVLQSHRRRGIAAGITARLTRDAFAGGVTLAFLTPGDEGAHRVYGRAGFADATTVLHMSRA